MSGWQPIETAPMDGTNIMIWDGIAVSPAFYSLQMSAEEWWEVVGSDDEDFDPDGYETYLEEEPECWVILNGPEEGTEYTLTPLLWQPYPSRPVLS